MKHGKRWGRASRITWRAVWRFSFCRSVAAAFTFVKGTRLLWYTESNFFPRSTCVSQNLLKRPEVAVLVNLRLENTSWTASRITRFLSTPSPDAPRKPGASPTWLDIYNDLNQTITTLAQVTEVHFLFPLVYFSKGDTAYWFFLILFLVPNILETIRMYSTI